MMQFISAEHIDRQRWDALVASSPQEEIFSYSWYLDAVCDEWHLLLEGDYEWGMALPAGSKMGMSFIYQPIYSRQLAVIGAVEADDERCQAFLDAIPDQFKFRQFGFRRMEEYPAAYEAEEVVHQQLELKDMEQIQQSFSTNARRNIRKAEREGLTLHHGTDPETLVDLFKSGKGGQLKELGETEYRNLNQLMRSMLEAKGGELLEARHPQQGLLAVAFFMKDKGRITYLKGAVTDEGKKCGAMHWLFREAFNCYAAEFKRFDFGGSKVESVAKFYKNFGAQDAFYVFLTRDKLPALVKLIKNIRSKW